jgi:hypothetical protein
MRAQTRVISYLKKGHLFLISPLQTIKIRYLVALLISYSLKYLALNSSRDKIPLQQFKFKNIICAIKNAQEWVKLFSFCLRTKHLISSQR